MQPSVQLSVQPTAQPTVQPVVPPSVQPSVQSSVPVIQSTQTTQTIQSPVSVSPATLSHAEASTSATPVATQQPHILQVPIFSMLGTAALRGKIAPNLPPAKPIPIYRKSMEPLDPTESLFLKIPDLSTEPPASLTSTADRHIYHHPVPTHFAISCRNRLIHAKYHNANYCAQSDHPPFCTRCFSECTVCKNQ